MLDMSPSLVDRRFSRAAALSRAAASALPAALAGLSRIVRTPPLRSTPTPRTPAALAAVATGPAVALLLLGAACMYFCDPDLGADRRGRLRKDLVGLWEDALSAWERLRGSALPSISRP